MRKCILPVITLLFLLPVTTLPAQGIDLKYASTYYTDAFGEGAAEIAAFDAATARLFFTNAGKNSVAILDIADPANPVLFKEIDLSAYGGGVNSVAVHNGLVAVAVSNAVRQQPGRVVFFDAAGLYINDVAVGAQPDMVTFTPDGSRVLTANEGEPDNDYTVDPEGSVSIIDVSGGAAAATARTAAFTAFNGKKAHLVNKGVRLFGPNATVAQDLEPEHIAVTPDGARAYVTLQENNALAVVDIATATVLDILPMGYKDHNRGTPQLRQYRLDNLPGWPTLGTPVYGGGQPAVKLGGFSGLYFDPAESTANEYVFYTIPDRGPYEAAIDKASVVGTGGIPAETNLRPFKLPNYQARIVKLRLNPGNGQATLDGQIFLRRFNPENLDTVPVSGRSNVFLFDEVPVTYQDPNTPYAASDWVDNATGTVYTELPYDPFGGDMGGIVRDRDGNFWLCDKYRPSVYKAAPNGVLSARYVPEGTAALVQILPLPAGTFGLEILPKNYSKRWENRGFSAIAYDRDNHVIYAFLQSPMDNPNSATVRDKSDVLRILALNAATGDPVGEYVYLLERNREAGIGGGRTDKIGDAVYLGNDRFLVLERDAGADPQARKYVYEISLQGATNILALPLARKERSTGAADKTLEMMSADELAAAGITPAHKTRVLNLPSLGYLPNDKPEGLTLLPGGNLAVINNNDFGTAGAGASDEISLGIITFGDDYGMDASDRDNAINISAQPVLGMYQPDAIAGFSAAGQTYFITANEGDAREYAGAPGLVEEARVRDIFLDPVQFANSDSLRNDAALGRLTITTTQGDLDGDGLYDRLYAFGARSFSVLDAAGNIVYDSGDALEQITAAELPAHFNSNNDDNDSFDSRSDNKGPEPKAVAVGDFMGARLAFVGLERIGGVAVFNIDNPRSPQFITYLNNRNFGAPVDTREAGDLGTGSLVYIPAADSPVDLPMLVIANEVSGTVSIFTIGELTDVVTIGNPAPAWRLFPNPAGEELLTNTFSDYEVYSPVGALLLRAGNTNRIQLGGLPAGTYLLRDVQRNRAKLFVKQ